MLFIRLLLIFLVILAMIYEPIRSGFAFANQSCELTASWDQVSRGILNFKHIIAYGLLCFVAMMALPKDEIAIAVIGTFIFSALLEIEQSFFVTGHCRSWDLIPNIIGIGLAVVVFKTVMTFTNHNKKGPSNT